MDTKLPKEDLLSMVVSTCRLNTKVALKVLHFSQGTLNSSLYYNIYNYTIHFLE